MARSVSPSAEVQGRKPWYRRYRLLVQIVLLMGLGAVIAAVTLLISDGGRTRSQQEADAELRQELAPLLDAVNVPPDDLPADWIKLTSGPGIQPGLREAGLGAATSAAESAVGNAIGFTDVVRQVGAGVIVANDSAEAQAAFERLGAATPEEVLRYVEPAATRLLSVQGLSMRSEDSDRFAFQISFERGASQPVDDRPGAPISLQYTVYWRLVERSLTFVTLQDLFASPPTPAPIDLERWLEVVAERVIAAEQAVAAGEP